MSVQNMTFQTTEYWSNSNRNN